MRGLILYTQWDVRQTLSWTEVIPCSETKIIIPRFFFSYLLTALYFVLLADPCAWNWIPATVFSTMHLARSCKPATATTSNSGYKFCSSTTVVGILCPTYTAPKMRTRIWRMRTLINNFWGAFNEKVAPVQCCSSAPVTELLSKNQTTHSFKVLKPTAVQEYFLKVLS